MKIKIVVTDDDPGVQDIFKIIFEKAGYDLTVFSNGDSILTNQYELPDIFLLDKQLSGMDGLHLCRHLKSHSETKDIPVIMVSATPGICKLAEEAGANDFLEKPFSIKELLQKVEKNLELASKPER